MASAQEIARAIDITRHNQSDFGKQNSRIHGQGAQSRAAVLNALEHTVCGGCSNLSIDFHTHSNRPIIVPRCIRGHSPVDIWIDLVPGEIATCRDCTDPAGHPPANA